MATKKEVYKVYSLLALFFLLIVIVWKTHQQYKGPSGVFKDTAIVDLHYKVLTTAPPQNLEEVPKVDPTEDPWESEQIRRKALLTKVCKENAGKTHMELDPETDRWLISFVVKIKSFSGSCTMPTRTPFGATSPSVAPPHMFSQSSKSSISKLGSRLMSLQK